MPSSETLTTLDAQAFAVFERMGRTPYAAVAALALANRVERPHFDGWFAGYIAALFALNQTPDALADLARGMAQWCHDEEPATRDWAAAEAEKAALLRSLAGGLADA